MLFDPESIEELSPAARVEVQDFYARKFLADRQRRFPERRLGPGSAAPGRVAAVSAGTKPRPRWPRVSGSATTRAAAGTAAGAVGPALNATFLAFQPHSSYDP
jgi:hypothetical protein